VRVDGTPAEAIQVSDSNTESQPAGLLQKPSQAQWTEEANSGAPFLINRSHFPFFGESENMTSTDTNKLDGFYLLSELPYDSIPLPMNYSSS
jgi:hypothetical protein